jgi:glycerol-3-phosphate dehydrogenase subunit C
VVEVLRINGFDVYFPEQKCCGMPSKLEDDRQLTLGFLQLNIDRLAEAVQDGYDIVCSCPTCGFMLKHVVKEGAYYSSEYQAAVGGNEDYLKIPTGKLTDNPGGKKFNLMKRNMYKGIFKDEGYFSAIDPMKRVMVAENTHDFGEYLANLHRSGALQTNFGAISGRMVYYPPRPPQRAEHRPAVSGTAEFIAGYRPDACGWQFVLLRYGGDYGLQTGISQNVPSSGKPTDGQNQRVRS